MKGCRRRGRRRGDGDRNIRPRVREMTGFRRDLGATRSHVKNCIEIYIGMFVRIMPYRSPPPCRRLIEVRRHCTHISQSPALTRLRLH